GALRWQQLSHHALRRGFGLDVITRDPGRLDEAAENLLARLPAGIRVFGVPDHPLRIQRLEKRLLSLRDRMREQRAGRSGRAPAAASEQPASLGRDEITFDPTSLTAWVRVYDAATLVARERAWARRVSALGLRILDRSAHRWIVSCGPPHWADHE